MEIPSRWGLGRKKEFVFLFFAGRSVSLFSDRTSAADVKKRLGRCERFSTVSHRPSLLFPPAHHRVKLRTTNKKAERNALGFSGTREGIRTPDLLVRSQTLYPTELQPHN